MSVWLKSQQYFNYNVVVFIFYKWTRKSMYYKETTNTDNHKQLWSCTPCHWRKSKLSLGVVDWFYESRLIKLLYNYDNGNPKWLLVYVDYNLIKIKSWISIHLLLLPNHIRYHVQITCFSHWSNIIWLVSFNLIKWPECGGFIRTLCTIYRKSCWY